MKSLTGRLIFIGVVSVVSLFFVVPWSHFGITLPEGIPHGEYKLGLDLNGWVELDYRIDMEEKLKQDPKLNTNEVSDGLKKIIEKRVNSLGTTEPTITSAQYGWESHIIVQIPTVAQDSNVSEAEQKKKNDEYIRQAKETIGKVVTLEFKEKKTTITDQDRIERKAIAQEIREKALSGTSFKDLGDKYSTTHENIIFENGTGTLEDLPEYVRYNGIELLSGSSLSNVVTTKLQKTVSLSGNTAPTGYSVIKWNNIVSTKIDNKDTKVYDYSVIWVNEEPSQWQVAKTASGAVLNDQYLQNAQMVFNQQSQPEIQLIFNDEGKKIFSDLTERLLGQQLAIFVWGQLITAPTIQARITDGSAVITGSYTIEEARRTAQDIKTGIVPAPIYLSSERTIDAKIGRDALHVIIVAGAIGLAAIIVFLVMIYRVSGLIAGVALVIYALILVAIVKSFGIVLTLASIAGMILSIGLAIDANILIFERMKEALREKHNLVEATILGFEKSWSAIWDSHVTSLTSAVILFIFGVNLIKWFGLMLGIGIVLSLFTAMWISRILLLASTKYFVKQETLFLGKIQK